MNQHLCLKIARRMNTLLGEALGEGVVARRMVDDPLYARDVLMVCDSMDGEELPKLARLFRQALLERDPAPPLREPLSIASMLNSIFGPAHTTADPAADDAIDETTDPSAAGSTAPMLRRWFGRARRDVQPSGSSVKPASGAGKH